MMLMVRDPENTAVNTVLVNNRSRDGKALKFVLAIRGTKKCYSILGCH